MTTIDPVLQFPLSPVLEALRELRANCVAAEREFEPWLRAVRPRHTTSARNLVHYVAFRRHDLRELQEQLARRGLSSLGRCEADVLGALDRLIGVVEALVARSRLTDLPDAAPSTVLDTNAVRLLGPAEAGRRSRVMVTMPTEAALDAECVDRIVAAGADIARINCAHDDAPAWLAMAANVQAAADRHQRACRIAVDLAGPKLRTGAVGHGPEVVRVAPRRDARGVVVEPAVVVLHHADEAPAVAPEGATMLPVLERYWLRTCAVGDVVRLTDARLARRHLTIASTHDGTVVAHATKTMYVESGATLAVRRDGVGQVATVGRLPERDGGLLLRVGDTIVLTCEGTSAPSDSGLPRIECTLPVALERAAAGHRIWFDDGKIGGVVSGRVGTDVVVQIVDARPGGARLKSGKGINLPDTDLPIAGLTEQDDIDLEAVVGFADIVNVSFVRSPSDVAYVQERLTQLGAQHVGIVLKIETASGFENLPEILLTAMCWERAGVMIARGDLAVEVGFERMAEVQEEIMWLCEAAHVPVIWATQVLDQLARTGRPSRAEITDAALGARAECIMLNKGPHIVSAITTLVDIHGRMHEHQHKKRALLRRLRAWDRSEA